MRPLSLLALLLVAAGCDSSSNVAEANSTVAVAYEGRLEDGTVFDGGRLVLALDDVRYIPGFREGIVGMAIGETKTFSIPPEQAYGEEGAVDPNTNEVVIPPNATLIFEVRLLDIL